MNITLVKALLAIVPTSVLSFASGIRFGKERTLGSFLQLLGAACLVIVVLTHFCEARRLCYSPGCIGATSTALVTTLTWRAPSSGSRSFH
jgi:hypothetical protein